VLASKGGEVAIFIEGRGAHGYREIRETSATSQSLIRGSERRSQGRGQRSISGVFPVESVGAETEARRNVVVGGKAAEMGRFTTHLSWVVARVVP